MLNKIAQHVFSGATSIIAPCFVAAFLENQLVTKMNLPKKK